MKRPEVTVENYESVFQYEANRGPKWPVARFGHLLFGALYHPVTTFAPGAKEVIEDERARKAQFLLTMNHVNGHDQYNLASYVQHEPALHFLMAKTVILTKIELYHKNRLQSWAMAGVGSIPAYRKSDVPDDAPEELVQLGKDSRAATITHAIRKINEGYNLASFIEGTRNQSDRPEKVQEVQGGIGHIYTGVDRSHRLVGLPIGIYYGKKDEDFNPKAPHVYIGSPITDQFTDTFKVRDEFAGSLQHSVDMAVQLRHADSNL